jgi:NAD(P)-dependent dehydrogenase (short-subunit alcohol dehydrogenase family)
MSVPASGLIEGDRCQAGELCRLSTGLRRFQPGIGLGLALRLHELGNQVIVAARRKELLGQIVSEHPGASGNHRLRAGGRGPLIHGSGVSG